MREAINVISCAITIVLALLLLKTYICSFDGWVRDCEEGIQKHKVHVEECEQNLDQKMSTLEFAKRVQSIKDSSLAPFKNEAIIQISLAEERVVDAKSILKSAVEDLEDAKEELIYEKEELLWHNDVIMLRLWIFLGSAVIAFVSFLDFKQMWRSRREKLLDKPSNVYVITRATTGKYEVVSSRWWMIRHHKSFDSQEDATAYALKLKNEHIKGHWYKIEG